MKRKRLLAGMAIAALVGTPAVLATATPAQADAGDCAAYLEGAGYEVNDTVAGACQMGSSGQLGGDLLCRVQMMLTEVSTEHASRACELAAA